jgi:predicted dithiol-disulfide oxidoreductase (DUF899 family)
MVLTRLPNESVEYAAKRDALRLAEIDLMHLRERVAELRRQLPPGPIVEDYVFQEGPPGLDASDVPTRDVRLSDLFNGPDRPLFVYHLMLGKKQADACPMCTMWIDGFNGLAHHLAQNVDVVVVAAAPLPVLRQHARARGWNNLRVLSAGKSTFKYDFGSEDEDGNQDSTVSVFTRAADGAVRHFYTAHARMADDIGERGIDLLAPVWHILDLTPQGRGDWFPALEYHSSAGTKTPHGDSD